MYGESGSMVVFKFRRWTSSRRKIDYSIKNQIVFQQKIILTIKIQSKNQKVTLSGWTSIRK